MHPEGEDQGNPTISSSTTTIIVPSIPGSYGKTPTLEDYANGSAFHLEKANGHLQRGEMANGLPLFSFDCPHHDLFTQEGQFSQRAIQAFNEISPRLQIAGEGGIKQSVLFSMDSKEQLIALLRKPNIGNAYIIEQIVFYTEHYADPDFEALVVPLEGAFIDSKREPIGMMHKFYGVSLSAYKRNPEFEAIRAHVKEQVDDLVARYQAFVELTGVIHGDLVWSNTPDTFIINHSNIRVDPKTGVIKLIDYHGAKNAKVVYNMEQQKPVLTPTREDDIEHEAENLQKALYRFFNIGDDQNEK